MNDWEKEQSEKEAKNKILATELKDALIAHSIKPYARGFEVLWADNKGVHVITDDRTHFKAFLIWPQIDHRWFEPDPKPSIKVAKSRGVDGLAKDIQKRLLPGYAEAYKMQLDRAVLERNQRDRLAQVVCEFNVLAGNQSPPSDSEKTSGRLHCCYHSIQEICVSENGDRAMIQTYHMPVDVAREVLALIVKRNPR